MNDQLKTKEELIAELQEMRRIVAELRGNEPEDRPEGPIFSKDFLEAILHSSTLVSIIATGLDQKVLFWNTGAENIFGYSQQEMQGAKITKLYPPDSASSELVAELRERVRERRGAVHGRMRQLTKDGRVVTVSLALSPLITKTGEVCGILGMGLDVTEEVRQQQEIVDLLLRVRNTQEAAIFCLAKLAECRDEETGSHLVRLQAYCRALCEGLAARPKFADVLTAEYIDDLVRSSLLHDIGKVGIPDDILLSVQSYRPEDRVRMQQHTLIGGQALEEAVERLGEKSFLSLGMEVAYHHHERWDGRGYPFGLKGEEIPLSARVVALADVYDALTTKRRYKEAFSHEKAAAIIIAERGLQFDPELVDAFADVQDRFRDIRKAL
jgi:PAS domain S-box-containing protein